jgi:hypothetical protein
MTQEDFDCAVDQQVEICMRRFDEHLATEADPETKAKMIRIRYEVERAIRETTEAEMRKSRRRWARLLH